MKVYARLMDKATNDGIVELRLSIASRVEVTAKGLADELADMLRQAYVEGCRDGYAEAVRDEDAAPAPEGDA